MYMEITPEQTRRELQDMLIESLPNFEFPDFDLEDYTLGKDTIPLTDVTESDFMLIRDLENNLAVVDRSTFNIDLTSEEINIIAILIKNVWLERQLNSIENTRMKYSGSDFKMTSQANHLSKLLALSTEGRRDSTHMQRLYHRRRRVGDKGRYESNWDVLREVSAIDY